MQSESPYWRYGRCVSCQTCRKERGGKKKQKKYAIPASQLPTFIRSFCFSIIQTSGHEAIHGVFRLIQMPPVDFPVFHLDSHPMPLALV